LFEVVGQYLASALDLSATLESETSVSAPLPGEIDPFSSNRADVGFLCAPGYFWLSERVPPAVELVPAAFQFDDPRTCGKPVYFAELVVRRDSRFERFADLRHGRWAYNDPCSLSGYFSMLEPLMRICEDERFFRTRFQAAASDDVIHAVLEDRADCGAVDSNVLRRCMREDASIERELRVLETWGPFPIQPIVVRTGLDRDLRHELASNLLRMHETERWQRALAMHGVRRLVTISEGDLENERRVFQRCFPQRY